LCVVRTQNDVKRNRNECNSILNGQQMGLKQMCDCVVYMVHQMEFGGFLWFGVV
jgi:hypothetical protein